MKNPSAVKSRNSRGKTAVPTDQPVVSVRNLVKHFRRGDGTIAAALDGISFDVRAGEFLVLLGPSGCGKTTLLRAIAGLETPDSGEIAIHGEVCFSARKSEYVPTERRGISMIFQSYALWPHMTVFDNIAYPLRNSVKGKSRLSKAEIKQSVERVLSLVGIPELIGQYPGQMSGGQQQRVALARALVGGTGLILFDEPLSNVDAKVRDQLRYELVSMQRELGFAAIYVTHDQDEAMSMAHRIAVLGSGKVLQIAPPREVYFAATSRDVANFVGKTNELEGSVTRISGDEATMTTALGVFTGVPGTPDIREGDAVMLNWRPEHTVLDASEPAGGNHYEGIVHDEVFLGSHAEYHVLVDNRTFLLRQPAHVRLEVGSRIWMSVDPRHTRILKK
jgi:iron(III) transport system ATP-binding protein